MRHLCLGLLALVVAAPATPADDRTDKAKSDVSAIVKGNNEFALELYGQLAKKDGNLFFSPYSISTALAMTYAGARSDTATEMEKALHFTLGQEKLHPAYAALIAGHNGEGKKRGYQLSVANALWGQKGYGFLSEFLDTTKKHYSAGLNEVDFVKATEETRQTINQWVEKQTQEKIKDLLAPGILTTDTRLVLTNAIYFKGDWASQFKKDQTHDMPFKLAAGKTAKVPTMRQEQQFGYAETRDLQVLEMPYDGKDLAMVVLLPRKDDGLAELEKQLTEANLSGWISKLHQMKVNVFLPRFKMTSEFGLNEQLSALGMKKAFGKAADFSGMNGRSDLYISAVVHKAFVDVNEQGTEAAAATAVVVKTKSLPPPTPVFNADHPFVFAIRDMKNGAILFLGRVTNP